MKRYILFFFTTIAVLSIDAVRTNVGGLNYTLIKESHEAIISYGNKCIGELDIPSEVNYNGETFVVKSMIWKAFYDSPELTKVRIPKTLESVMHYYPNDPDEGDIETILVSSDVMNPFSRCYSLESIEVDEENPSMKSVDGVLISKDGTRLYCYPIGKQQEAYSIPEDVEWIGANAFEGSHNLTTLTIPNNITHICSCAFQNCNNLTDLYCYAENVPTTGVNVFNESPIASATLHVPAGSIDKYKAQSPWSRFGNIVAMPTLDPVTFTEGQMATIILPAAPDASKGKYYRLDRYEDGQIIFEQELQPQAHIPYIIVPNEDFSIDLRTLDLTGLSRDTVSIAGISFIGSFTSEEFDYEEGAYIDIIDKTPDCRFDESCVIGALRAYLLVHWDDPYNQGGTRVPPLNKRGIVLRDYETGISMPSVSNKKNTLFDLQGRKLQGKPTRGIYIGNGQKILIK